MSNEHPMHDHHHHGPDGHPGFDPVRLRAMEEHRREFMPPEAVVEELAEKRDRTVLDVGCGVGYYAIPAARLLTGGRLVALDVQENMVRTTLERAREAGLENVEGIVAPASRIPLDEASIDAALVAMVYHDLPAQPEALAELRRVLKPDGILSMVEWDRIDTDFGPPMEIRITPPELTKSLEGAGFEVVSVKRSEVQQALYFVLARPTQR